MQPVPIQPRFGVNFSIEKNRITTHQFRMIQQRLPKAGALLEVGDILSVGVEGNRMDKPEVGEVRNFLDSLGVPYQVDPNKFHQLSLKEKYITVVKFVRSTICDRCELNPLGGRQPLSVMA